jgi:hypothetical protein
VGQWGFEDRSIESAISGTDTDKYKQSGTASLIHDTIS